MASDGLSEIALDESPLPTRGGRPVLLDLFCGAGGATKGYQRAGFEVVGVDIERQPHYCGDHFLQADALEHLAKAIDLFYPFNYVDAIHASPPCQAYSDLRHRTKGEYPDLVAETQKLLDVVRDEVPWVIENVEGAPLRDPVKLCGVWFMGLRVIRHRLFESNVKIVEPPCLQHPLCYTRDKRKAHYGQCNEWDDYVSVNGGGNCSVAAARDAMGIDWMTKSELNEAIPPAYTEWVGGFLMEAVTGKPWAVDIHSGCEDDGSCESCTAKLTPGEYEPCAKCGAECGHGYCRPCEEVAA